MQEVAAEFPDALDVRHVTAGAGTGVPFAEFARWSVLLDLPGGGWSGRLKFLPFLGRPLVVLDRAAWGWAEGSQLEPYKHYRPVQANSSGAWTDMEYTFDPADVLAEVEWCRRNPKRAAAMARRALLAARRRFSEARVARQAADVVGAALERASRASSGPPLRDEL